MPSSRDAARRNSYDKSRWSSALCKHTHMADAHQQNLLSSIARLMDDNRHTDLIIRCEGRDFSVHKAIMCSVSPFVAKSLKHEMKESRTGVLELEADDPDTVERLIQYIYTQDYTTNRTTFGSDTESQEAQVQSDQHEEVFQSDQAAEPTDGALRSPQRSINEELIAHVKVYAIADFHDMPSLMSLAKGKFLQTAAFGWQIDGFIDVVAEVDMKTSRANRDLRNVLRSVAMDHVEQLVENDAFMEKLAELEQAQDLACDLLKHMVRLRAGERLRHRDEVQGREAQLIHRDQEITNLRSVKDRQISTLRNEV